MICERHPLSSRQRGDARREITPISPEALALAQAWRIVAVLDPTLEAATDRDRLLRAANAHDQGDRLSCPICELVLGADAAAPSQETAGVRWALIACAFCLRHYTDDPLQPGYLRSAISFWLTQFYPAAHNREALQRWQEHFTPA